jgi:polar amino acid transport system substrate-binding protein
MDLRQALRRGRKQRASIAPRILAWVGLLLLAAALPRAARAGDLADVKARGKLILVAYPLLEGNFVVVDVEAMRDGKKALKDLRDPALFHGIDVDLARGFAASLGVNLEIHPVTSGYDGLIPALKNREGDIIASSFTITPNRQQAVDFSRPYLKDWIVVAVKPGSPIASLADLKGKKAAVMHGSSQLERLQALNLDVTMLLTDFALQNYVAVTEGKADFTLMDSHAAVGESVSPVYPQLKVAFRLSEFGYGVAVRKGSDLLHSLNAYIDSIEKSGELDKITLRNRTPPAASQP